MCNTHCKLKNTRSHFGVKGKVWYIFFIKEEFTSLLDALTLLEVGKGMSCIASYSGPNYFSYYSLVKLQAAQWKWTCRVSILPKGKAFFAYQAEGKISEFKQSHLRWLKFPSKILASLSSAITTQWTLPRKLRFKEPLVKKEQLNLTWLRKRLHKGKC